MLSAMKTPVLTLDESRVGNLDPQDPGDLSALFSALSKTSHIVEQGERFRNFSWRLWSRERLCCTRGQPVKKRSAPTPQNTPASSVQSSPPQLSSSVESTSTVGSDDENVDLPSIAVPGAQWPLKERHITPLDLRNMVHSINQPQEFKTQTRPKPVVARVTEPTRPAEASQSSPQHREAVESSTSTVATATTDSFTSAGGKSDSSVSSNASSQHSIVRGFTPGASGVTSYTSKIQTAPPTQPQPQAIVKKTSPTSNGHTKQKSNGMFMLGCSSGSAASGEEEPSLRDSVISRSLRSSGGAQRPGAEPKKQTSFKDDVAVMKPHAHEEAAVFDDSEDEDETDSDNSESAIEEDDDAWEDEAESQQSDPPKSDEMKFYRVDSAAHLPSRRSALTLNLEGQRNHTFRATPAYKRSRTSTPNGPSMPGSPEADSELEMRARQMAASKPIMPAMVNNNAGLAPLTSPRTTRRNMMHGELSESLRKNMLSERQQRNPLRIESNPMRRAHTAHDVSRMGRLPEHGELPKGADDNNNGITYRADRKISNWDHFFEHRVSDFHEAGW